MHWLICGISSFITSACLVLMVISKIKEKNVIWVILYSFLVGMNFLSGLADFLLKVDFSPKTVIVNILCCFGIVLMIVPTFIKKVKEWKNDDR